MTGGAYRHGVVGVRYLDGRRRLVRAGRKRYSREAAVRIQNGCPPMGGSEIQSSSRVSTS